MKFRAYNNSVAGNGNTVAGFVYIGVSDSFITAELRNNLVVGFGATFETQVASGAGTFENVVYSNNAAEYDLTGQTNSLSFISAGDCVVDPNADLNLIADSDLIGAGVAVAQVTTDILGATRPSPPAIGAFELIAVGAGSNNADYPTSTAQYMKRPRMTLPNHLSHL
jgi:hypothetical protein